MLRCLELGDLPSLKALTRCLMGITVDVVAKKEVAERCLSKLAAWLQ